MSETNNPNPLAGRNRYCAICDKYFCRSFSLKRHNLTKHLTTSPQVGGGRFSETRKNKYFGIGPNKSIKNPDEDDSAQSSEEIDSDESTKNSVEDGASTDSSEHAESTDADDSIVDFDDGGPEMNDHDKMVSWYFIN